MAAKTVDEYIEGLEAWKAEVVSKVRQIVLEAAPEAKESIKWAQPVYELNGPFCYIKAFKKAVNFGFWRGVDIQDPKGLLQGTGDKMRHAKLTELDDIDEEAFAGFVRQATQLNLIEGEEVATASIQAHISGRSCGSRLAPGPPGTTSYVPFGLPYRALKTV